MKKFAILLIVLNLCACSANKKDDKNNIQFEGQEQIIANAESIKDEDDINEDNFSIKSFKPGSNWNVEHGDYDSKMSTQMLKLEENETSILEYNEVFLYPGMIKISFEYTSNQEDDLTSFEIRDDNNEIILNEKVDTGLNEFNFENPSKIYSGSFYFKFDSGKGKLDIIINNFQVSQSENVYKINLNQVGYLNEARKVAIFSGHHGDYFNVKSIDTDEIVATYPLSEMFESKYTDEYVARGDFSSFDLDGEYYLESSMGMKSYPFFIGETVYNDVLTNAIRFFTAQRCGIEIAEEINSSMQHQKCHDKDAKMITSAEMIDVSGGWHDAGDYGRYVETAVKALSDLLISYIITPNSFNDQTNRIEENDGVPDVLDEARYELEWLLKMQREDGGVYSRAVTKKFPGNLSPSEDEEQIYVLQVSTASSAGFCAVMSLASKIYQDFDPEFSEKCLEAALLANRYLNSSAEYNPTLPEGFTSGDYALADDDYYRFYANIALWFSTDEQQYLDKAFSLISGDYSLYNTYWEPLLAYPSFLYLLKANKNDKHYDYVANNFYRYLDNLVDGTSRDNYRISLNDNYHWGSNQNIADRAMLLLMGNYLSGRRIYKAIAEEHLDYLLGKNCLNMSFVVGYGERYPHHIHHRVCICNNSEFKGALVGGPNSSLEDEVIRNHFEGQDIGPARIYMDDAESYSTNEVAIHFNSALVFVLAYLNQGE